MKAQKSKNGRNVFIALSAVKTPVSSMAEVLLRKTEDGKNWEAVCSAIPSKEEESKVLSVRRERDYRPRNNHLVVLVLHKDMNGRVYQVAFRGVDGSSGVTLSRKVRILGNRGFTLALEAWAGESLAEFVELDERRPTRKKLSDGVFLNTFAAALSEHQKATTS